MRKLLSSAFPLLIARSTTSILNGPETSVIRSEFLSRILDSNPFPHSSRVGHRVQLTNPTVSGRLLLSLAWTLRDLYNACVRRMDHPCREVSLSTRPSSALRGCARGRSTPSERSSRGRTAYRVENDTGLKTRAYARIGRAELEPFSNPAPNCVFLGFAFSRSQRNRPRDSQRRAPTSRECRLRQFWSAFNRNFINNTRETRRRLTARGNHSLGEVYVRTQFLLVSQKMIYIKIKFYYLNSHIHAYTYTHSCVFDINLW